MSGRYESIRHDGVIIFKGLTAYKPVFDVTTLQTMSTNELHQFPKSRTHLGSFMTKWSQHWLLQTLLGDVAVYWRILFLQSVIEDSY